MKSAKDFAEVWKINSVSAAKRLKKLGIEYEEKYGSVLYYSDETFSKITGIKVPKKDLSNLISSDEIAKIFNIKDKSVRNHLRKKNVKIEFRDGWKIYFNKEKALNYFQKKPEKKEEKKSKMLDTSNNLRYRISVFSQAQDKFIVKYMGLKKENCLKKMTELFNEGWNFCIKSYEVGESWFD